jgi:1-deoxy-D-xylulose-5-phosphate reductoisomerase
VQYALSWPERWDAPLPRLDLAGSGPLEFEAPDIARFPCLELAYRAARAGGVAPAVLNAADEVAVGAFLDGRIRFPEIAAVIEAVLAAAPAGAADSLERVLEADRVARLRAAEVVAALGTA